MPQKLAKLDSALSFLRLERIFLGRQKFCHYRSWYRTQLSDFVRDTLLSPTALARPYLNGQAAVKAAVEDHIRGTRNFTVPIHKLLTLELIHKNLLAL
jgi:asparagine synthase (glutamine-hydrolysing)